MLHKGLCYIRVLVALRILPFGTLPAVLHQGSCYIKGMLYKGYTTVQVTLELATDLYEYSGTEIRLYVWDKATNAWAKTTGTTKVTFGFMYQPHGGAQTVPRKSLFVVCTKSMLCSQKLVLRPFLAQIGGRFVYGIRTRAFWSCTLSRGSDPGQFSW